MALHWTEITLRSISANELGCWHAKPTAYQRTYK
jgi:hypothetical protein